MLFFIGEFFRSPNCLFLFCIQGGKCISFFSSSCAIFCTCFQILQTCPSVHPYCQTPFPSQKKLFPFAIQVFNFPDHATNVYGTQVEVDYRGFDVTVENFLRLLLDRHPPGVPTSKRLLSNGGSLKADVYPTWLWRWDKETTLFTFWTCALQKRPHFPHWPWRRWVSEVFGCRTDQCTGLELDM